jgi:hypothetical protein
MARRSCPYCYVKIDTRKPWFRCTGRPAPGRQPCQPQWDDHRAQAIGIKEMVLPSFPGPGGGLRVAAAARCPHCTGESGLKVCPNCHSRLPAGFGENDSPLIAVVGARHTGKSVYLKVLSYQLRHGLGRQFDADVRLIGDGQFQAETGGGQDFLDPAGDLFPDGGLYQRTNAALEGRREPIVFGWRQRRVTGYQTTYLSFFDTAGEDLGAQDSVDNLRYLGAADALILLLDPFMIPQARDRIRLPASAVDAEAGTIDVVNRVTENLRISHRLGGRRNIPIPVAVAFAKIDAFFDVLGPDHPLVSRPTPGAYYDEQGGRGTHEHVRALLHDWGAAEIDLHFVHNYQKFRYFAVSSLGAEPDYDANTVDVRGVRPFRVEEPLLWLLSEYNVVPRSRADR